ncbi:hypothetical protein [Yersinia pekkanenii]|uniref:Uncharacterized protein n=1 Tax=Yersinia pekkanenii TaxID=1288385 RepID=A0A0T9RTL0_9GAMM|nr:hypothetical protein [Yersinia pekkanenii]CNI83097.1 Uncharacterised protein [Yersinia pekkanenii]CRY69593.1 Uncharacterised protein [Yersinia pekkanenii]
MTSLNIPEYEIVNVSDRSSEVVVLLTLLKDAYTHEHAPEETDTVFALTSILKLAHKLNSDLSCLLNNESGEAKS